jgi:DNA polymerase-3 subunit chi
MATVDFYLLTENSLETAYGFICRLLDKIYQQKHHAYVYANSQIEAKILDDLLWTFRDDAFIPHCLYGEVTDPMPSIQIGFANMEPQPVPTILLNLTPEIPPFAFKFQRIVELVVNESSAKTLGRQKYRQYRENNCELNTHDLIKT